MFECVPCDCIPYESVYHMRECIPYERECIYHEYYSLNSESVLCITTEKKSSNCQIETDI